MMTATYSPEDNKLRLYSSTRLDSETYARVKAAGFKWAPKQDLFVAPMWTPGREDILIELCGEIGDEDTSLVERAEERAERFEEYSDKRGKESDQAHNYVSSICEHIPFGQPILVGHHSEKRARKDAERIENGMRKAVKLWETSKYWQQRAAGAIHHAKYKELPTVRARRIKGLEADKRKQERTKAEAEKFMQLWQKEPLTMERAIAIANYDYITIRTEKDPYGSSLYSELTAGKMTETEAAGKAIDAHYSTIAWAERWINHYTNRLIYEKAMLDEQGASDLLKPKAKPKQLPICNYKAPEGFIMVPRLYSRGELEKMEQMEMTTEQYSKVPSGYRGCKTIENSHRVRVCIGVYIPEIRERTAGMNDLDRTNKVHRYYSVFLTDSKTHAKPEPIDNTPKLEAFADHLMQEEIHRIETAEPKPVDERKENMEALKDQLKTGIKVVSAPQLFPTPPEIAEKMVELADLEPGLCVLEPSAGTGNLVKAVLDTVDTEVLAYEINQNLCSILTKTFPGYRCQVRQRDFLEVTDFQGQYPRIIMNPPFENGADIKHIRHALTFLKPGGKLVALCANGPRQREAFKDIADYWEDLPQGSFKEQGTNVNVAMFSLTA